jgi:hypothetical protein
MFGFSYALFYLSLICFVREFPRHFVSVCHSIILVKYLDVSSHKMHPDTFKFTTRIMKRMEYLFGRMALFIKRGEALFGGGVIVFLSLQRTTSRGREDAQHSNTMEITITALALANTSRQPAVVGPNYSRVRGRRIYLSDSISRVRPM